MSAEWQLFMVSKKNHNAVSNLNDPWAVGQSAIQRHAEECIFEGRWNHEYAIDTKFQNLFI